MFGGTFDPPHLGHLIVADDAATVLDLDEVCFFPTGIHPLKAEQVAAPAELRLRMIEAATAGAERFTVDDRELRRPGLSYTIDTIVELQDETPGVELFLLVGADILGELERWHRVEEIAQRARIAVMSRADSVGEADLASEFNLLRVEVTHVAISSSDIRERIRCGRPWRYLVPEPVYEIIERNCLYRDESPKRGSIER